MNPRVWYVTVFVSDLLRAIGFYRDRVGLSLGFQDEKFGYARFETDGAALSIARVEPEAPNAASLVGRHTGIALGVPDIYAAHKELESRGVEFEMAPCEQPWGGVLATFSDPDGNILYLDQLRDH